LLTGVISVEASEALAAQATQRAKVRAGKANTARGRAARDADPVPA
jgi:hypothetical protein